MLGTSACDKPDRTEGYRHIGTVVFRRSYAGHENWSQSKLDSVEASHPVQIPWSEASDEHILRILHDMGLADEDALIIGESDRDLRDTVIIEHAAAASDTAFIEKDTIDWQLALRINNGTVSQRLPFDDASNIFVAYLAPPHTGKHPYLVVVQSYYIMNGDNYEVAVYGKAEPGDGEK